MRGWWAHRWCPFAPMGANRVWRGLPYVQFEDSFLRYVAPTVRREAMMWRALPGLVHGAGFAEQVFDLIRVNSRRVSL